MEEEARSKAQAKEKKDESSQVSFKPSQRLCSSLSSSIGPVTPHCCAPAYIFIASKRITLLDQRSPPFPTDMLRRKTHIHRTNMNHTGRNALSVGASLAWRMAKDEAEGRDKGSVSIQYRVDM